jgi:NTP pyrophosphatase (non-canonical NTP hydrolase)
VKLVTEFDEYQKLTAETAIYPEQGGNLGKCYTAMGLAGEAGEVADKTKKYLRDDFGEVIESRRNDIRAELGDVMWYVSQVATEWDLTLDDICTANIEKLLARKNSGMLHGEGDNR